MKENNMYKKLPPFKWFVLQNFPFIEEDFDAITNYQLLCKVVEYLNRNIDKTNELGEQVEALTNWFENLDVQDEINNKLDDMAESGQLAEIINEQIFNELNTKVDNFIDETKENFENVNQSIEELEKTELVVFGDSWTASDVTDSIWSERAGNVLNLNVNNFAVNGAGFVSPVSKLISTQVNNFRNSEINKNKVKYIVVLAGINDYRANLNASIVGNAIKDCVQDLQELCPNAKILYVSNCQYPRTINQSNYWNVLHDYLSTESTISTLNLDDVIDLALYNTNNYFHLTQNGQKFMCQKIISALTGGEITPFHNIRFYEDDYIRLAVRVQKQGNFAIQSILVYIKQEFQTHTLTLENTEPDFPYGIDRVYSSVMTGDGTNGPLAFDYKLNSREFVLACQLDRTFRNTKTAFISNVLPLMDYT